MQKGEDAMRRYRKRIMVTLPPELELQINTLLLEMGLDDSNAKLFRQLIYLGLAVNKMTCPTSNLSPTNGDELLEPTENLI